MVDENLKDQLVLVPKLAQLFANEKEFAYLIGLDNRSPGERASLLEPRIGFILAMYRAMKTILRDQPCLDLNDKFVMLIHSRISLIPEVIAEYPDVEAYARQCYIEAKQNVVELGMNWDEMSLKEKFFEVCLRTETEEIKLLTVHPFFTKAEVMKVAHRNTFSLLFEKTFEFIDWQIEEYDNDESLSNREKCEVEFINGHVVARSSSGKIFFDFKPSEAARTSNKNAEPCKKEEADVFLSLSKIYDEDMKNLSGFNLSKEQSFWASFAIMSLREWDALDENGIEVKFSNLLRLYTDFYINSLNVKMKDEDKKDFLRLLKKKYNLVREKVYHEEFEFAGLPQVIFGEQPNELDLWPLIVAAPAIIKLAWNHSLLPYNLVKDI